MIYKVHTKKKYPFKHMKRGDQFKLNDEDVRDAQKIAYYYRKVCKRPFMIAIVKRHDGHYCQRVS